MNPVESWINNYNTENTRDSASKAYKKWNQYLSENDLSENEIVESMLGKNENKKYEELGLFIKWLKAEVSPATTRQYYNFIKQYLRVVHGIKTYQEDAKFFIKPPRIVKVTREPLDKKQIRLLCKNADPVHCASYLILSSSGMRISEFLNSTEKNYHFGNPTMIKLSGGITKTQTERITFISKEAEHAINEAGSDFWKKRKLNNEEVYFHRLRDRIGLVEKYDSSRNFKVNIHSMRAYFRTIAGEINRDYAEKLIGHEGYLGQYTRLTEDNLRKFYRKLEPKLAIF